MATPSTRPYTFGSLFTGIGGIDLAFVRAGFDVSFQVEIDDYCRKVLAKHAPEYWPNAQVFEDVRHVGSSNLPNVDVLGGGFPCQDISTAGKRAGIKEGTRSGLWFEFARIIGEIRPRVVMLENVAAITSRDGTRVIADLAALGYDAEWGIIPASAVGAPHKRERWWCVAYRQNAGLDRRDGQQRDDANSRPQRLAVAGSGGNSGAISLAYGNSQRELQPARTIGAIGRRAEHGDQEVGYTHSAGSQRSGECSIGIEPTLSDTTSTSEVGNTANERLSQPRQSRISSMATEANAGLVPQSERSSIGSTQSIMGRAIDGLSRQLDGARWPAYAGQPQHEWEAPRTTGKLPNRAARLKALGNAVVPQVVQPIAEAILAYLKEADSQASAPTGDAPETTVASVDAVQS